MEKHVLQCVAACCSGLQWVAVGFSVLQCVAHISKLVNELECGAYVKRGDLWKNMCCSVLQRVAAGCGVLQRVAVC